ncbi:Pycsar system effector family protein [Nitrincola sp. MINF-07-Sa-05]|uniref:Pycsar system effector family protein n=1 Tax=Nitrincola salilacus TaxID=3400273 RepID=UPI0039184B3D
MDKDTRDNLSFSSTSSLLPESLLNTLINSEGRLQVEVGNTHISTKMQFAYNQLQYLSNSTRFADIKAAALAGVIGTLIGILVNEVSSGRFAVNVLLILAGGLLVVGLVMALDVVFPRRVARQQKGILYWEAVQCHSAEEYLELMVSMPRSELLEKILHHNYLLSGIVTSKYRMLHRAFMTSAAGLVCLLLAYILNMLT